MNKYWVGYSMDKANAASIDVTCSRVNVGSVVNSDTRKKVQHGRIQKDL